MKHVILRAAFWCAIALFAVSPGQALAQGDSAADLQRFFNSKDTNDVVASIDFQVTGGFAEIQTGSPESSGRYYLESHYISRLTSTIFRLDLNFAKKLEQDIITFEPPFVFKEKRSYFFWYNNGDRIVFRVDGKRVDVPIARKEIMRVKIQSLETYTIEREKLFKDIQFGDARTMVYIQIKFI
mgnify:CR=1 FL=1